MNIYVKELKRYGYKAGTTSATAFYINIDPVTDARAVVMSFGATCSSTAADKLTAMVDIGTIASKINTAALSGASTVVLTADPKPAGGALAANDYLCIELDNGAFQFNMVASGTSGACVLTDALQDTVAAGNRIWALGARTDTGHAPYNLVTASTQYRETSDNNGIFYGAAKASPMMIAHNNAGTTVGSIDWVSVAFVDI